MGDPDRDEHQWTDSLYGGDGFYTHLVRIKEEMQHLIVCTVLVSQRCDRMIGTDQHGAVHFLSIPFGQLIDILNRSAVPVFPKGHAVRLIASLIGGMCFLHVCQRLEQVIQSIEVRFAKLGIEIPPIRQERQRVIWEISSCWTMRICWSVLM